MKKFLFLTSLLALASVLTLYASMSDSAALKAARVLWGAQAKVGSVRNNTDSNWTRQVGYQAPGCAPDFQVVGSGFNTWDAAFADAAMHPANVLGPYKGMLTLNAQSYDDVAVTGMQFFVDGVAYPEIVMDPAQRWTVGQPIDTTLLADGFHVFCASVHDGSGNKAVSAGYLFQVTNAATGTASTEQPPLIALSVPLPGVPLTK